MVFIIPKRRDRDKNNGQKWYQKLKGFCIRSTDTASVKVHSVYTCTISSKYNLSSESLYL